MERNKLDKEFKEKLDNRVIAPSQMAWDRLDAMLTLAEAEEIKTKPSRSWLYLAAGFIGFILGTTLFLNYSPETANNSINNSVVVEESNMEEKNISKQHPATPENSSYTPEHVVVKNKAIANNNVLKRSNIKTIVEPAAVNYDTIAAYEVKGISTNAVLNITNNPLEADNLLAQSTPAGKKHKKQTVKVDANRLLNTVENELDNTYRNKTLQTIAKNYQVVKSAVANRNHQ